MLEGVTTTLPLSMIYDKRPLRELTHHYQKLVDPNLSQSCHLDFDLTNALIWLIQTSKLLKQGKSMNFKSNKMVCMYQNTTFFFPLNAQMQPIKPV